MLMPVVLQNELARLVIRSDAPRAGGRPRKLSVCQALKCIFYVCRTGCQWNELPCPQGVHFKTVYHRFHMWSKMRIFEDCFYNLVAAYRSHQQLPLVADTSYVKNIRGCDVIGRNHTDRGRHATKVSLLSDSRSIPLTLAFHRGNRNDLKTLGHLLDTAQRKLGGNLFLHGTLYADKGYDAVVCRNACTRHGLQPRIPRKMTNESWNSVRCAVEVTFGRLDNFRRILMRHESGIVSFKAFHFLAASYLVAKA